LTILFLNDLFQVLKGKTKLNEDNAYSGETCHLFRK